MRSQLPTFMLRATEGLQGGGDIVGSAFVSYGSVCFVESPLEDDKKRGGKTGGYCRNPDETMVA